MGRGGLDAVMSVEVRGRQRLGGLLSRLAEPRECRVAAASRPGLLRRLRPAAPTADRHAVVLRPDLDYVMVAAFAGHGPHGASVAELAAEVIADVLERRLIGGGGGGGGGGAAAAAAAAGKGHVLGYGRSRSGSEEFDGSSVESAGSAAGFDRVRSGSAASPPPTPDLASDASSAMLPPTSPASSAMLPPASSPSPCPPPASPPPPPPPPPFFPVSVELAMQDAFVEASIAIDATPWARHSGATATVAVVRAGVLVVGAIGDGAVLLGRRRAGVVELQRLAVAHRVGDDAAELERVTRFGGHVRAGHVADKDGVRAVAVSRALGDLDMRGAGLCQLPHIGSMAVTHRDSLIALSTVPLWEGDAVVAPDRLCRAVQQARVERQGPFELSRRLLDAAFGASGPSQDATVVCMQLRR